VRELNGRSTSYDDDDDDGRLDLVSVSLTVRWSVCMTIGGREITVYRRQGEMGEYVGSLGRR